MRKFYFVLLAVVINIASAKAQPNADRFRTLEAVVKPQFVYGKLFGCSIKFSATSRDYAYHDGLPFLLTGAVGVLLSKSNEALVSLRLTVNDFDLSAKQFRQPAKIESAYFISGVNSSRALLVDQREYDGALLLSFKYDALQIIFEATVRQQIIVAFNRRHDGLYVTVPINLSAGAIPHKHAMQMANDFSRCTKSLLGRYSGTNVQR